GSNSKTVIVTPWTSLKPVSEAGVRRLIAGEGLSAYGWSNAAGDTYVAHAHDYNKVIYVVQGTITFGLTDQNEQVTLAAGDRLYLPAGIRHDARIGPRGVYCLEAHC